MRFKRILACLFLLTTCTGCQSMWGGPRWAKAGPHATHGRDEPAIDDPWVKDAGDIARGEHPAEAINDPLGLRNLLTSEKARQIERNVGVGD